MAWLMWYDALVWNLARVLMISKATITGCTRYVVSGVCLQHMELIQGSSSSILV
jgi:hypothetical protein